MDWLEKNKDYLNVFVQWIIIQFSSFQVKSIGLPQLTTVSELSCKKNSLGQQGRSFGASVKLEMETNAAKHEFTALCASATFLSGFAPDHNHLFDTAD